LFVSQLHQASIMFVVIRENLLKSSIEDSRKEARAETSTMSKALCWKRS